ncbi:MAG TPA: hypothetical protein VNZ86_01880, partial [Bacteroidia bacterium]|nr:hypothetical protein [Bacteroidia bacterium]
MKGRTCISSLSFLLSLSSLLLVNKAEGGNSYYYCSSGNWSTNSGFKNGSCAGAASAVAPTAADDVTISGAGTTVVIDANATCHTLTILNGATISIPGILVSLTVAGDLVINSGGTLVKGGLLSISTLNLAGNLTNNGTCTLGTSTLNKATLCFTGSINTVVSGTGAFTVYDIVLNTGSKTTAVDVQSATFILGINNAGVYNFTFTQGTFMFDANATLNDCHNNGTNTALTIPFNTVLEFDQGTTTLCSSGTSGAVLLSGKLFLNGG